MAYWKCLLFVVQRKTAMSFLILSTRPFFWRRQRVRQRDADLLMIIFQTLIDGAIGKSVKIKNRQFEILIQLVL